MASKKWIKGPLFGRRWLRVTLNQFMNRVKTRNKIREKYHFLECSCQQLFCGDWCPVSVCIFKCKPASVGHHWLEFWRQKSLLFGLQSNLFLCLPLLKMKAGSLLLEANISTWSFLWLKGLKFNGWGRNQMYSWTSAPGVVWSYDCRDRLGEVITFIFP